MAEAVILRAIESLDCWLVKKKESNLEKLYSLIVGMSDLGEENKVHALLLQFEMMIENEYDKYEKERKKVKLYNLLDLKEEKMKSLVVGMADFWEDDKGKLYYLMFLVDTSYPWGCAEGELRKKKLCRFLIEMTDLWGGDEGELKKEKLQSLLIEITDMWRGDVGELNKEKLHSLLIEIIDLGGSTRES